MDSSFLSLRVIIYSIDCAYHLKQCKKIKTPDQINVTPDCRPYILATRLALVLFFVVLCVLVKIAWRRKKLNGEVRS